MPVRLDVLLFDLVRILARDVRMTANHKVVAEPAVLLFEFRKVVDNVAPVCDRWRFAPNVDDLGNAIALVGLQCRLDESSDRVVLPFRIFLVVWRRESVHDLYEGKRKRRPTGVPSRQDVGVRIAQQARPLLLAEVLQLGMGWQHEHAFVRRPAFGRARRSRVGSRRHEAAEMRSSSAGSTEAQEHTPAGVRTRDRPLEQRVEESRSSPPGPRAVVDRTACGLALDEAVCAQSNCFGLVYANSATSSVAVPAVDFS